MCTALLPTGVKAIVVKKYIYLYLKKLCELLDLFCEVSVQIQRVCLYFVQTSAAEATAQTVNTEQF